jgi:hypothetical protein
VLYFKEGRKNAAIATQPYSFESTVEECTEAAREYAEALELALHVPRNPFASIWYPGSTLFLVLTELDHINWLPEQESGVAFPDVEAEAA